MYEMYLFGTNPYDWKMEWVPQDEEIGIIP